MNKTIVSAAVLGAASLVSTVHAVPDAPKAWEKCAGLAQVGKKKYLTGEPGISQAGTH